MARAILLKTSVIDDCVPRAQLPGWFASVRRLAAQCTTAVRAPFKTHHRTASGLFRELAFATFSRRLSFGTFFAYFIETYTGGEYHERRLL
jgi:hypothetical protein